MEQLTQTEPTKSRTRALTTRVSMELYETIRRMAVRSDRTPSQVVRKILRKALDGNRKAHPAKT